MAPETFEALGRQRNNPQIGILEAATQQRETQLISPGQGCLHGRNTGLTTAAIEGLQLRQLFSPLS